jgi:hypothetical protein
VSVSGAAELSSHAASLHKRLGEQPTRQQWRRFLAHHGGQEAAHRVRASPWISSSQRRNLGFVFLQEIGSLGVFVQGARFILLNPDADQLMRDIMPLGKRVQALPGNELLRDLPLERDAVGALSGHGSHPLKAQLTLSNH